MYLCVDDIMYWHKTLKSLKWNEIVHLYLNKSNQAHSESPEKVIQLAIKEYTEV